MAPPVAWCALGATTLALPVARTGVPNTLRNPPFLALCGNAKYPASLCQNRRALTEQEQEQEQEQVGKTVMHGSFKKGTLDSLLVAKLAGQFEYRPGQLSRPKRENS
ncbi:hypothetical protein [Pseudomonas putida]|uniref:hypothetical protein n=1 Tax=Pseudomonas putida TaxID=303 RepID=UPI002DBE337C|nr:hypothetical protein [Pseudomonas putida]WRW04666.1 hypothetical protein VPZ82_04395 [Pseudomonas putida]